MIRNLFIRFSSILQNYFLFLIDSCRKTYYWSKKLTYKFWKKKTHQMNNKLFFMYYLRCKYCFVDWLIRGQMYNIDNQSITRKKIQLFVRRNHTTNDFQVFFHWAEVFTIFNSWINETFIWSIPWKYLVVTRKWFSR